MEKKHLLIADDDEMNRRIIRKFLKDDYEIMEASDGRIAMTILQTQQVDALLLDIIMPEMDGLEVLTALKQDQTLNHVGVLVATSTKEKTEREALSLGADDIVSKPYDPVVIKKRIENILTVKAMESQQKLLVDHDTEALYDKKREEMYADVEASVNKIGKFTDIIRANKSNYKLVDEILDTIKAEAGAALACVAKKDKR